MKIQNFNSVDGCQFVIEELANKLRLVILKEGEELACRKTTKKELTKFFEGDEKVLFKGRLQLRKDENGKVEVMLKGKLLGFYYI